MPPPNQTLQSNYGLTKMQLRSSKEPLFRESKLASSKALQEYFKSSRRNSQVSSTATSNKPKISAKNDDITLYYQVGDLSNQRLKQHTHGYNTR